MKHPDAVAFLRRIALLLPDEDAKDAAALADRIDEAYDVAAQNNDLKRFYLAYYALASALGGPV